MTQMAFYVNSDACITCKACGLACKDKNDLAPGRKYRKIYSESAGDWVVSGDGSMAPQNVFSYSISLACNHCESPMCFAACPVGAIEKREDGIVFVDKEACTGCGACAQACPYGAPSLDAQAQVMGKCDFCMDLLDEGQSPACVRACLQQALEYGDFEELRQKHPDAVQQVAPLPDASTTSPSLLISAHRKYAAGTSTINFNMPEEVQASE